MDANAGEDQVACGLEVNLNALDQGAGAMFNWWSSAALTSENNEEVYIAPYWGGRGAIIKDETQTNVAISAEDQAAQETNPKYVKKDVLVYVDIVSFDNDKTATVGDSIQYFVKTIRTVYYDETGNIAHMDESITYYQDDDLTATYKGQKITSDLVQEIESNLTEAMKKDRDALVSQAKLYHVSDEIFNLALSGLQSSTENLNPTMTTFRWYKHNEMYDTKHNKLVSCTSWDEVQVTTLSLMNDLSAGPEQVLCNDEAEMHATNGSTFDVPCDFSVNGVTEHFDGCGSNYKVKIVNQYWEQPAVHGYGEFDDVTKPNAKVSSLAFDTNIFRWRVEAKVYLADRNEYVSCTMSDDVYITNAQPSHAALGDDKEVCETKTTLSTSLSEARAHGT